MSVLQRDYLMRLIEQFAELVATLVGLKAQGRLDEASALVEQALGALLGPMRSTIDSLAPSSVVILIGSKDKLRMYAHLLAEQADILKAQGHLARAQGVAQRSEELAKHLGVGG